MNAKKELLDHIEDRSVKYVWVYVWVYKFPHTERLLIVEGVLEDVIDRLDFDYDNGYGRRELHGHIWYEDGTWSERGEYDGHEWWEHNELALLLTDGKNTEKLGI